MSKTKEVRWNTEKSQTEHRIKKYPSNQQNIHHDSIEKCEIKVAPVSTLGQDNTTTTDTTGSYVSSASNIDISSTSMRDEGNIHYTLLLQMICKSVDCFWLKEGTSFVEAQSIFRKCFAKVYLIFMLLRLSV